ncbi:MAG: hypothetical protein M0Z60_15120 [Nitrospiraceae bacterium]|nr:hypothetical protein [Nitrospiraceae bacterium]
MGNEETTVSETFRTFGREIKPLIAEIRDAFVDRPVPIGRPASDFGRVANSWIGRTGDLRRELLQGFNALTTRVLSPEGGLSREEIRAAVAAYRVHIADAVGLFHEMWLRPFPAGIAEAQPLFSSIIEKILRCVLMTLEEMADIIDNPETAADKYGSTMIHLHASLDTEAEELRLNSWCERHRWSAKRRDLMLGFLAGVLFSRD